MSAPARVSCNLQAVESDSGLKLKKKTETVDFWVLHEAQKVFIHLYMSVVHESHICTFDKIV